MAPNARFYSSNDNFNIDRSFKAHKDIVTSDDETLIRKYIIHLESNNHISESRGRKIAFTLVNWKRFIDKPYREIDKDDIEAAISGLKKGKRQQLGKKRDSHAEDTKGYKVNTIRDHIKILKQFMLYLGDRGINLIPEKQLREIKAPSGDYITETDKDLLTDEEINNLLSVAKNSRDRALLAYLAYTGARIGEACRATWHDIVFDDYGAKVYIDDRKTKKRRYARITRTVGANAIHSIQQWHNDTQYKDDSDFIFTVLEGHSKGQSLSYQNAVKIINKTVEAAGISKRVHAHLFRKSAITLDVARGTPENIIKETYWGNQSSAQLKTYIQVSEKQIDHILLERDGLLAKESKKKIQDNEYKICPNCQKTMPGYAKHCLECGWALSPDAIAKKQADEQAAIDLRNNPEFLRKKLEELEVLKRQIESLTSGK